MIINMANELFGTTTELNGLLTPNTAMLSATNLPFFERPTGITTADCDPSWDGKTFNWVENLGECGQTVERTA